MHKYRITKYDPRYRNRDGIYTKQDWTSVSDTECGALTIEKYIDTEDRYIRTFNNITSVVGISCLIVSSLEKMLSCHEVEERDKRYGLTKYYSADIELFNEVKEGIRLNIGKASDLIRLILREYIWCELSTGNDEKFTFGYDHYMYFYSDKEYSDVLMQCTCDGIFIEELTVMRNG